MSQEWQKGHKLDHQTILYLNPGSAPHLILALDKLAPSEPQLPHLSNRLLWRLIHSITQWLNKHVENTRLGAYNPAETAGSPRFGDCIGVNQRKSDSRRGNTTYRGLDERAWPRMEIHPY